MISILQTGSYISITSMVNNGAQGRWSRPKSEMARPAVS